MIFYLLLLTLFGVYSGTNKLCVYKGMPVLLFKNVTIPKDKELLLYHDNGYRRHILARLFRYKPASNIDIQIYGEIWLHDVGQDKEGIYSIQYNILDGSKFDYITGPEVELNIYELTEEKLFEECQENVTKERIILLLENYLQSAKKSCENVIMDRIVALLNNHQETFQKYFESVLDEIKTMLSNHQEILQKSFGSKNDRINNFELILVTILVIVLIIAAVLVVGLVIICICLNSLYKNRNVTNQEIVPLVANNDSNQLEAFQKYFRDLTFDQVISLLTEHQKQGLEKHCNDFAFKKISELDITKNKHGDKYRGHIQPRPETQDHASDRLLDNERLSVEESSLVDTGNVNDLQRENAGNVSRGHTNKRNTEMGEINLQKISLSSITYPRGEIDNTSF